MKAASSIRCARSSQRGMTPADRLLDTLSWRVERRLSPHLRGIQLLMDMPTQQPPHALSRDRALRDRHARRRRRPQPLLGAVRQSRTASRSCSCTAAPAAGPAPTIAASSIPTSYKILVFDQRGCGRSTPYASLEANTTWDLVDDIERLRDAGREGRQVAGVRRQLGLDAGARLCRRPIPERVTELVLRGIFLFDQYEIDWMYKDGGASQVYPDKLDEFLAPIPEAERGDLVEAYRKRLTSDDQDEQLARRQGVEQVGRRHRHPAPEPDDDRGFHRARRSRSPSPGSRTITWPTTAGSRKASCCAAPAS